MGSGKDFGVSSQFEQWEFGPGEIEEVCTGEKGWVEGFLNI